MCSNNREFIAFMFINRSFAHDCENKKIDKIYV